MQKHFPQILKRLISPQIVPQHGGNIIGRYLKNRQNLKYCRGLWREFSQQNLINEGVQLRRKLKHAIDQQDKVHLLKVCSIPLYEKLKKHFRTVKLGSWGYHFKFLNLYRITQKEEIGRQDLAKSPEWIRAQFQFKEQLGNGKLADRHLWIERKVQQQNLPIQKKWYIYDIQY